MLRLVFLFVTAGLLVACSQSTAHLKPGFTDGPVQPTAIAKTKSKGTRNQYFRTLATKDSGGGSWRFQHALHAPFRVECRLGDFSERQAPWGEGYVAASLSDPAILGIAFLSVEVRRSGPGVSVRTVALPGGADVAATDFADGPVVDIAIEHTGSEVVFLARTAGTSEFQELRRHPTSYLGPFAPAFDVYDLAKGAESGVDDVVVVSDTDPPDLSTPESRARRAADRALYQALRAMRALDNGVDDTAAATTALAAADEGLVAAADELRDVDGNTRKAAKALAKARKRLAGVAGKLGRGKSSATVVKPLRAALLATGVALARLPRP